MPRPVTHPGHVLVDDLRRSRDVADQVEDAIGVDAVVVVCERALRQPDCSPPRPIDDALGALLDQLQLVRRLHPLDLVVDLHETEFEVAAHRPVNVVLYN